MFFQTSLPRRDRNGSPDGLKKFSWRVVAACCGPIFRTAGSAFFLSGLFLVLLLSNCWFEVLFSKWNDALARNVPLGRDPIRWRFELSLQAFPLELCAAGFAAGAVGWSLVEVGRRCSPARLSKAIARTGWTILIAFAPAAGIYWRAVTPPPDPMDAIPVAELRDPIEDDPSLQFLLRSVDLEVDLSLKNVPRRRGFCHAVWNLKKAMLKQKYGVEWRTPAEMNPETVFE